MNIKKITASSLALLMALSSSQFIKAEEDTDKVEKDETVYAFLSSDGTLKSSTVSEWLHHEGGFDNVQDESILNDITNIKGDEAIEQNGSSLVWNSTSDDIYYQGSTNKELPISMKVTYYFNGQKVQPEDVLGESGALEVHIKIINNEEQTKVINGRTKYISSLFPVAIVTDLKTETFKDVDAEDATIINESKNQIVCFATVSGASQMLAETDIEALEDVKDSLKDEFVIKANVTDFEMPSIIMATTSVVDVDHDDLDTSDLDKVTDGINDLKDATAEILDGTVQLHDANIELNDKMGEFQTAYAKFQDGLNTATDSQGDIVDGAKQLSDGISQMKTLMNSLTSQLGELDMTEIGNLLTSAGATVSSLPETVKTLQSMKSQLEDAKTQLSNLASGINATYTSEENAASTTALLKNQFAAPVLASIAQNLCTAVDNTDLGISINLTDEDKAAIASTISSNITAEVSYNSDALATITADVRAAKTAACGEDESCLANVDTETANEIAALTGSITVNPSVNTEAIVGGLGTLIGSKTSGITDTVKTAVKTQLSGALTSDDTQNTVASAAYNASTVIVNNVASQTQTSLTDELSAMQGQLDAAIELCNTMTTSVNSLISEASKIDLSKVSSLGTALQSAEPGLEKLISGSNSLYEGTKSMQSGLNTLSSSSNDVTSAINQFKDATQELAEQTGKLNDGVQEFSDDGIDKLSTEVNDAINDLNDVIDTANATLDQSVEYSNYAGASDSMKTTVKFIMKTDEVKKAKDTTSTDTTEDTETSTTLLQRITNLFKH